jgi:NAD(P)-dependent dehydrogenase (short-subunit alcohol dehydrogenase family)
MSYDLLDVRGRTAVVTGASSGLGVTYAKALAGAGASVVLAARRTDRLETVVKEIEADGGTAVAVTCDVIDAAQVEALVATACDRFGRVDIMVNNAGVAADAGPMPERIPDEAFEYVLQVNLLGTWYGCRSAGARMLADGRGGSIINVSSVGSLGGKPGYPVGYAASKAAVISLTRGLAVNWADRRVRVNALAPGWFPSEMADPFLGAPVYRDHVLDQQPTGRIGDPQELVGALLFLASDASSYVTGHTLFVDGGMGASYAASRYSDDLYAFHAAAAGELGERIMPG